MKQRTDLAMEARELHPGEMPGVSVKTENMGGAELTRVSVTSTEGAENIGKPIGEYLTLELPGKEERFGERFDGAVMALSQSLRPMLPEKPRAAGLVVGLGNYDITPDSLGPRTVRRTIKTRHLVERSPEHFGDMRPVAAIEPGVLGSTGVETAELVRAVTEKIRPEFVVVVDALASRSLSRVCRTVQIADSGIVPGSGVGNARAALNQELLGVPVIAVGVPTVVDAATMAADLTERAGLGEREPSDFSPAGDNMIVTPKDIDAEVADIAKLVAYGINLALHPELTIDDVDAFLD